MVDAHDATKAKTPADPFRDQRASSFLFPAHPTPSNHHEARADMALMTRQQIVILRAFLDTFPMDPDVAAIDLTLTDLLDEKDSGTRSNSAPSSRRA